MEILSAFLLGLGQLSAMLLYLLYKEWDAFRRKPVRLVLSILYFLLLSLLQFLLHRYIRTAGMGSLPALPFLLAMWLLSALFLLSWGCDRWENCCFIAFVFVLIDSSIWPIVSSLSRSVWGVNFLYEGSMMIRVLFLICFAALECLLALLVRKQMPDSGMLHLNRYHAILTVVIAILYLTLRGYSGQSTDQTDKSAQIITTVCCLSATITLACMVGHGSGEYEKQQSRHMEEILQNQQLLFEQKLKDADMINRRYHDMKNFLLYLKADGSAHSEEQSIDQLLESITPFGNAISVGNEVIDVILGEKLALCEHEQITCIPYVDGAHFSFVQPLDICTLFGNSMDNAIESCRKIPETDRRIISLHSIMKGNSSILTVRNTFAEPPDLQHGLPVTTKTDRSAHGYGLKNMQLVAEKYNGTVSCRLEGEEFILTILLMS